MLRDLQELKNGAHAGRYIAGYRLNPNDVGKPIEQIKKILMDSIIVYNSESETNLKFLIKGVENRYQGSYIGVLVEKLS